METLEALYLPQFPDSCYVFFHAVLHFALLITHGGWPLGEYVVGGDGITRGSGALRTGGSALGLAANSFRISSDRKSTRLNSSHRIASRMPSSA